ncbi:MAG: DUF4405 domain-containing protein [Betaproteobacteria bacterium]|nr:DUF4405 domain-containing protein [Betaproteobacteria bacterium]
MRLSFRHQAWIYSVFGVLFVSGALWVLFHYFVKIEGEFGPTIHPLEPWWLKIHGAAVMVFLFLLGTLLLSHMETAWCIGRNIPTGVAFVSFNLILVVSGYMLYYFGGETARPIISLVHWVLGMAAPVIIGVHVWRGRAERPGNLRKKLHWRKPAVPPKRPH